MERLNPAGSVKDRVALALITDAEERGLLKPGSVIVEPTSGNTGIGLAAVAAVRGYRVILTMPETMSAERRTLLAAYGAELVLTDGARGMAGAVEKAEQLASEIPNAYMPGQFTNPANPRFHYEHTGPEIWNACDGSVDIFVAGIGTGGTITGIGRYLKNQNLLIKVFAVAPAADVHSIQGIGAGFVPAILDTTVYDSTIKVSDDDARETAREIALREGLLVGFSSGAAVWAATQIALLPENAAKTIITILPDTGERYLSVWNQ